MKESSCHNPKMAAYCQEVQQLEDKFDGLELNHILRWLNEAADALAKAVSSQEPVLPASSPTTNTSPQSATRSQNRPAMSHLSRAQGLTPHWLLPTLRSWRLMRTQ
jgi:hypothetical protein